MDQPSPPHRANVFVDAHVHFYDCFSERAFFESADRNFGRAAAKAGGSAAIGCLCFTECASDHYFSRVANTLKIDAPDWTVGPTEEDCSLIACRAGTPRLLLVAGRQIVTSENLEVLALGTNAEFADGASLEDTVSGALECGATVIVPWGFGKWWFTRGHILKDFLQSTRHPKIFVGDNGGRPALAPPSPLFTVAAERGYWMLPGSDPLPLPRQTSRTGAYGFVLEQVSNLERPAATLKQRLNNLTAQPATFGGRVGSADFVWSQIALRLAR